MREAYRPFLELLREYRLEMVGTIGSTAYDLYEDKPWKAAGRWFLGAVEEQSIHARLKPLMNRAMDEMDALYSSL